MQDEVKKHVAKILNTPHPLASMLSLSMVTAYGPDGFHAAHIAAMFMCASSAHMAGMTREEYQAAAGAWFDAAVPG